MKMVSTVPTIRPRNKRLRLLVVSGYPSEVRPAQQVFVHNTLRKLKSLGVEVTVLAPESSWNLTKAASNFRLAPRYEENEGIAVYRPRYLSYSTKVLPWRIATRKWSDASHVQAALLQSKSLHGSFDLCLGHFLYPYGLAAASIGEAMGIPSVVSLGESSFRRYESAYTVKEITRLLKKFYGAFANSSLIKKHCVDKYGLPESSIHVFPNGVDDRCFYQHDRMLARQRLALPLDRHLIIFVGKFIERKGPWRVLRAIESRPEIGAVFLGYGPQVPKGPQVLYAGAVPHEQVPLWLSAADLFVLPTLDEGCCNAILEAMHCGLPVVSSDLPFNHNILDQQTAVLIDPLDKKSLMNAIFSLLDEPARRAAVSKAALQRSYTFQLEDRARHILEYLNSLCRAEEKQWSFTI